MHSSFKILKNHSTIISELSSQVSKTPEKLAVKYLNHRLSYQQLDLLSNHIAHFIIQNIPSTTEQASILISLDRSHIAIATIIACVKLGITYVPFDPRNPDERLHYMLSDCGAVLAITSKTEAGRQNLCPELYIEDLPPLPPQQPAALPETSQEAPAYIMYTSGSTGKPKGVLVPQQGILRLVVNASPFQFSSDAVVSQCGNIAFDASTLEIWGALLNGATLVIIPYETVVDTQALEKTLQAEKITDAFFTVALFNQLVTENPDILGSLNNVLVGGDALNPKTIGAAMNSTTPPGTIWNAYGPTENTVITTLHRITQEDIQRNAIPIGSPISETQCYVLDSHLQRVMPGEEGELYTSGSGLALGYLNKPDKTAESFIPNPFYLQEQANTPHSASALMYKTGDRVRLRPDGLLDFIGRMDNQVKIRGFRLEPGEVEHQLCQIPGVGLAVVSAVEHHGQKKLAAWCQSTLSASDILTRIRQQVPGYMVPSAIQVLEKLPITGNGKVDKRQLPSPQFGNDQATPPQTATETALSQAWQQILTLPHPPGREDHFFSLGGHSLLVVKLKQKIYALTAKEISLADLFRLPTLAEMAAFIDAQQEQQQQVSIARLPPGEKIPLSNEQQRLWLACCREPQQPHYAIPLAFRLSADLDPQRLSRALDALCQRHESLRLRIFHHDGGTPWQQVANESPRLQFESARDENDLAEKVGLEIRRPFTFGDDPLLRITLYRVPDRPWLLLINIHHTIADGWSMGVFFRELSALYRGHDALSPLAFQFPDYCAWQQNQQHDASLRYWRQQLKDAAPLQLPVTNNPQPGVITHQAVLSASLHAQLKEVAIQCHSGLFNIVWSALALALSRLSNQQDISIASIWANRPYPALAEQVGFFANTLVLRTQVDPQRTLLQWLKENHVTVTQGFQHGAAPLSDVLASSGLPSSGNQHPLCPVLLVLQNTDGGDGKGLHLEGCHVAPYPLPEETAKSDLLINLVPRANGELVIEASFRNGVWPDALPDSFLEYYQQLLTQMTSGLQHPVAQVMEPGASMRHQQLQVWNPAKQNLPSGSVLSLFMRQVAAQPDALAVRDFQQQLSYRQLDERASLLAGQLRLRAGDLNGKRIVFALDRSVDTVVAMIAILKNGAIYVPFDPSHPDKRLDYVLEDCSAACLIAQASSLSRQNRCPEYDIAELLAAPIDTPVSLPSPAQQPDDVAYIMYTSGSTGAPKGVEVLHQGIIRLTLEASPYQVRKDAVMAQAGNIAFDASTLEIWGPLLNGAQLVVIPYETVIDSAALSTALAQYRVTDAWFTVALFNQLASENPCAFGGLEHLLIGGDALNPSIVASVLASDAPPAHIWNGYGPTENTTFTTLHPIALQDCQREAIPIGRPIAGTVCYVLDEQLRLLPPGVAGELYTSGLGLAKGYLNKPEKTAESFMANPFWNSENETTAATCMMYKTGDRVRWTKDGSLDFLGRTDNQVKIRGYRLEPGEVEHRLCALDEVSQATVAVQTRQGQKQLVAWCVSQASAGEILRTFRQQVPSYMVPGCLQVVDSIPLTANGKVDKSALPPADFSQDESSKTLPRTPTECRLAEIWQQLLQQNGPYYREDNFFNIGGHSLLVIKMTDLIRRALGKTLSVEEVFHCQSLAELADRLDGKESTHSDDEARQIFQDSQLPLEHFVSAPEIPARRLLLTGATGFLGIYLLATLQQRLPEAVIYCLVRGQSGPTRLKETANKYQITLNDKKIRWLDGDLNQPQLGLSEPVWQALAQEIDAIYHCGAWVNHLHRYATLRAANVTSTLDLLKLCTHGQPKQLFYVSTLSAAARRQHHILEQAIADHPPMKNGYVQSKWVCEQLLTQAFSRGLHGAIYRMGNITGSTQNGISNIETNHTLNLIKGCLQQGVAPDWPDYHLDISPVNMLASLLVDSSLRGPCPNAALNLGYLARVAWQPLLTTVAAKEQLPLRFVSAEAWAREWVPQIGSDNALYPFKSFYLQPQNLLREEIEHTLVEEAGNAIDIPKLLETYSRFWSQSHFLDISVKAPD